MIPWVPPETAPSPLLLVHGEPPPFLAQPSAMTWRSQKLPSSMSMSKHRPSAPTTILKSRTSLAYLKPTFSGVNQQLWDRKATWAGHKLVQVQKATMTVFLSVSFLTCLCPNSAKTPAWERDLGMEARFDSSNPRGKFLGEKVKLIFHSNTTNNKTREEQCWKYVK